MVKAWKKEVQNLLWHALNKLQACALIPEWVVLWPNSLIAGIYDSVDATGPVAEVDYAGDRGEEAFVSLSFSPSVRTLRKP